MKIRSSALDYNRQKIDQVMVIFRENTEDIYAGIEYAAGTPEAQKILDFLQNDFPKEFDKVRFGTKEKANAFWKMVGAKESDDVCVGIGIKPVSYSGSVRLIHSAISYAIQNRRKSVTLVHKGNIMFLAQSVYDAESETHRVVIDDRAMPIGLRDANWFDVYTVSLRVLHNRCRGIKAHRLIVNEACIKFRCAMHFQIRAAISQNREADRMNARP